jgi:hypothetical protein
MPTRSRALLCGVLLTAAAATAVEPAAAPPPYALPIQLRGVSPANVVRLDDSLARSDGGWTDVAVLHASWEVHPGIAPFLRVPFVGNWPQAGGAALSVANPGVGVLFGVPPLAGWRVGLLLGATVPVGMGGGNQPNPDTAAATNAGVLARAAMDNALFSVDDLALIPGVDVAWVGRGLTVQAEATLLQLMRVRGAQVQPDPTKTNFTAGAFVGYFPLPELSVGAELRYQRWLSTPVAVAADPSTRDNLSIAIGLRGHLRAGDGRVLRPGVAFAVGLRGPLSAQDYRIVQLDLPVSF